MAENETVPSPFEKQDEDSDCEYEYDETETEVGFVAHVRAPCTEGHQSFYVTVDVSSASQHGRAPKKNDPLFPSSSNSQSHDGQAEPSTAIPIDPALQDTSPANQAPLEKPQDQRSQDRIQILDLHTKNPLISYHDRIYACNWASTIGTDIFLASPESLLAASGQGEKVTPIYNSSNVSIIGTSCINLTARPTTITPRNDAPQPQPSPPTNPITETMQVPTSLDPSPPQPSSPANPADTTLAPPSPTQAQPHKIPLPYDAGNTSRAQASFLESLMAIKASKGETDQVTVHATKQNHGTGWRVQRRLAAELEAAELEANSSSSSSGGGDDEETMDLAYLNLPSMRSAGADATAGAAEPGENNSQALRLSAGKGGRGGRTRGSRGRARVGRPPKTTYRRKGVKAGGLFRDYVPDAGDTVGADIRAVGGDGTPSRWEEVEGQVRRTSEADAVGGMVEREGGDGDVRMEDVG
ncbi:MAG: hypothetical protein L6R36_007046 [Xanthoria steineri]|nr:MAG: hypothetical protein L6R36_007046 [Xanthoria steineri]